MKTKIIYLLLLLNALILIAYFQYHPNLKIIACDVGQGDAILLVKGNFQVLIDGGPNRKVLDCLGKYISFWDRRIEVVILTHPDFDHYGGLSSVFETYQVDKFFTNGITSSTQSYKVLESTVGGQAIKTQHLMTGQYLTYDLIYLDILNPDVIHTGVQKQDGPNFGNDQSIVIHLKQGYFDALLMADVENEVNDQILKKIKIQSLEYIKVNHHGSKNGLSENLVETLRPKVAVISAGKENRYGHPDKSVLDILLKYKSLIKRTDEQGDIVVEVFNDSSFKVW